MQSESQFGGQFTVNAQKRNIILQTSLFKKKFGGASSTHAIWFHPLPSEKNAVKIGHQCTSTYGVQYCLNGAIVKKKIRWIVADIKSLFGHADPGACLPL